MAKRDTTFLLKRSNVAGKVPSSGDLVLGEMALNTADVILYTSGTTANTILPIGWDRIHRTGDTMTGNFIINGDLTVTGNSIFNSVTANTISNVDYIDFNISNTVTPQAGRLFFDDENNSMSYNPITTNNDVTLQIGQESWIRVLNNTGSQINNGQVVHITGATSGVPTVTLAIASGDTNTTFHVDGVATHDIADGDYGFITHFGLVRGLNLTAFTLGEVVYLSQTTYGGLTTQSNLNITGRTTEIGHVLDNSSGGTIQVLIDNESKISRNTLAELNILNANNSTTGVFTFDGITITSTTQFNVGAVKGWIVDSTTNPTDPLVKFIDFSGSSGLTTPYLTSSTETYISLTSGYTISLQSTFPTPQQRRESIYLGKLGHANKTTLINAFNEPDYVVAPLSQTRDMFTPIRLINDGILPFANGSNLNFNTTGGVLYGFGIGMVTNQLNPNSLTVSSTTPTTFQYRVQTGGTATNTTNIDPTNYDLGGTVTLVGGGSNSSTNQRIYLLQNGQIRVQYGQTVYSSLPDAIAGAQSESFVTFTNFKSVGILIGILSVTRTATDLSDITQARFLQVSKFGEAVGSAGGISTTTLQQAYNNSLTPEILTNSTLGAFSVRNGAGTPNNVTNVFEGVDSGGTITSFVRADGAISATTYYGDGSNLTNLSVYIPYILTGGTSYTFSGGINTLSVKKSVSSPTLVNLPATPMTGDFYVVKDRKGDTLSYPITVSGNTETIDGYDSFIISTKNKTSITFLYDGEEYIAI
jgi:hypothetical protein